jgi:hypothetical protein
LGVFKVRQKVQMESSCFVMGPVGQIIFVRPPVVFSWDTVYQ